VESKGTGVRTSLRVLIVEDDHALRSALTGALEMVGYEVRALADGTEIAEALEVFRPDLVGLDVYLPEGPDGFELAKRVRSLSSVPIVFLTAADSVQERLRGFDLGGDDYVVKPFSMAELLARVRALLRRAGRLSSATWEVRDLLVDEQNRVVIRADTAIDLTPTEFDLLCLIGRNPGQVHSKAQLLSEVWGFGVTDPNLVEVCMSSLRRKLEANGPRIIFTQRGRGYFLRP
jgi:two-component system OmpR family response regulator